MNWNNVPDTCEQTRAAIADSLIGRDATLDRATIDAHLAACAECRQYEADCRALWAALAEMPAPAPAPAAPGDAARRFEQRLASERVSGAGPAARRWAAIAAVILVAALAGYGTALATRARSVTPAAANADSMPRFLLLLYDTRATDSAPPAQAARIVAEYSAWARGLRAAGHLVAAEKLRDDPARWYGGAVATHSGERIGGFFLIRARDAAEAERIAADCPHVRHGGRVELRAIQPT